MNMYKRDPRRANQWLCAIQIILEFRDMDDGNHYYHFDKVIEHIKKCLDYHGSDDNLFQILGMQKRKNPVDIDQAFNWSRAGIHHEMNYVNSVVRAHLAKAFT